jgi:4-carboxymuconolactone decarboxylase
MDDPYAPLRERGAELRTQVLGEEYVRLAAARGAGFGGGYQDVAISLAWGGIWGRPGLDLRTRSLLTVAALTALNRPDELRMHIAGALRNGVTREELEEIFIHVGLYAGFPCAVTANRVAQQLFDDPPPGLLPEDSTSDDRGPADA